MRQSMEPSLATEIPRKKTTQGSTSKVPQVPTLQRQRGNAEQFKLSLPARQVNRGPWYTRLYVYTETIYTPLQWVVCACYTIAILVVSLPSRDWESVQQFARVSCKNHGPACENCEFSAPSTGVDEDGVRVLPLILLPLVCGVAHSVLALSLPKLRTRLQENCNNTLRHSDALFSIPLLCALVGFIDDITHVTEYVGLATMGAGFVLHTVVADHLNRPGRGKCTDVTRPSEWSNDHAFSRCAPLFLAMIPFLGIAFNLLAFAFIEDLSAVPTLLTTLVCYALSVSLPLFTSPQAYPFFDTLAGLILFMGRAILSFQLKAKMVES